MGIPPFQFEEMRRRVERNAMRDPVRKEADAVEDEIKELHHPIIAWCKQQQPPVPYVHTNPAKRTRSTIGAPDFVLAYRERTLWIECKSGSGELSPAQHAFIKMLNDQGVYCAVVTSMQQFYELVR